MLADRVPVMVPRAVSKRVFEVAKSLELHREHCLALGEPVHTASVAAVRAGHPEAILAHRKANSAKHNWESEFQTRMESIESLQSVLDRFLEDSREKSRGGINRSAAEFCMVTDTTWEGPSFVLNQYAVSVEPPVTDISCLPKQDGSLSLAHNSVCGGSVCLLDDQVGLFQVDACDTPKRRDKSPKVRWAGGYPDVGEAPPARLVPGAAEVEIHDKVGSPRDDDDTKGKQLYWVWLGLHRNLGQWRDPRMLGKIDKVFKEWKETWWWSKRRGGVCGFDLKQDISAFWFGLLRSRCLGSGMVIDQWERSCETPYIGERFEDFKLRLDRYALVKRRRQDCLC